MPGELVPILIVLTVCVYFGWRRYLQHQERIAAIQRGMDPQTVLSAEQKMSRGKGSQVSKDYRLESLVLIAIGLAYAVAVFLSVGVYKGLERAVAAAVWGFSRSRSARQAMRMMPPERTMRPLIATAAPASS